MSIEETETGKYDANLKCGDIEFCDNCALLADVQRFNAETVITMDGNGKCSHFVTFDENILSNAVSDKH